MGKCYDPGCSHRSERDACSFFKFPKSPGTKKKWTNALDRSDRKEPSGSALLCSCHFPDKNRKRTPKFKLHSSTSSPRRSLGTWGARRKLALNVLRNTPSKQKEKQSARSPWKVSTEASLDPTVNNDENVITTPRKSEQTSQVSPWKVTSVDLDFNNSDTVHDLLLNATPQVTCLSVASPSQSHPAKPTESPDYEEMFQNLRYEKEALLNEVTSLSAKNEELQREKEELNKKFNEVTILMAKNEELQREKEELNDKLNEVRQEQSELQKESDILRAERDKSNVEVKSLLGKIEKLQQDINGMLQVSQVLKKEKEMLLDKVKLLENPFAFDKVCTDENIAHFTGLPNVNTFYWLLSMVPENLTYIFKSQVKCLSKVDQLFLTLFKLRRNVTHLTLSMMFKVSQSVVSNVVLTHVSALHTVLVKGIMGTVPSLAKIQLSMPEAFADYPNCRMIIDCTEVTTQIPTAMSKHNLTFSSYKKRTTFKGLKGIVPNGTTVFVSQLYPGSTSDNTIVEKCGILDVFEPGDAVMADKGFLIKDLLPRGVSLNIPPFKETEQFTRGQIFETLKIARSRIHIERAIQRMKRYHILDLIPASMFSYASEIFQVCGALCNLMRPLICEVEDLMRQS